MVNTPIKVLSIPKIILFVVLLIGLGYVYYKNVLDVSEDGNKALKLLKHSFIVLVLSGFLSILHSVETNTEKFIIVLGILLIINLYNVSHSLGKCKYKPAYEINMIGRSSIILLIISLLLYYSSENNIFGVLYSDRDIDVGVAGKDIPTKITLGKTTMPTYCPDMSKGTPKWRKTITKERKTICRNTYAEMSERSDVDSGVYA